MVRDGTRLTVRIHRAYDQVVSNRGQRGYLKEGLARIDVPDGA